MTIQGVPATGFKTVGQIVPTNELKFGRKLNALAAAIELLSHHTPGGPVVDEKNHFIGFISEFDVLRALEAGKDLNKVTVEEVMKKDHISVVDTTSIKDAVHIMEEKRLLSLPVERKGEVMYTVTRHDLLRAWIGLGLGIEDGNE
ncbi:CBS domain-containing protein [Candidatus Nitrospira neomarina]|uniref:CBS domain-containing protein n=1 Tax=Candidatus Nitrospira neomarina TaxID=3020899 RepID=A0AA96GJQ4_9BACT|nr:CBS domain-containing protein [Candidatus Nitrospira neomarina]WNM62237.1 CBS domain-containing protein [Candidatus Nitrospira neomarina]